VGGWTYEPPVPEASLEVDAARAAATRQRIIGYVCGLTFSLAALCSIQLVWRARLSRRRPRRNPSADDAAPQWIVEESSRGPIATEFEQQALLSTLELLPRFPVIKDIHENPCAICLCGFDEDRYACLLPCTHRFHYACYERWVRSGRTSDGACPVCKFPLVLPAEGSSCSLSEGRSLWLDQAALQISRELSGGSTASHATAPARAASGSAAGGQRWGTRRPSWGTMPENRSQSPRGEPRRATEMQASVTFV